MKVSKRIKISGVVRGGSGGYDLFDCFRCYNNSHLKPDLHYECLGFRLVNTL